MRRAISKNYKYVGIAARILDEYCAATAMGARLPLVPALCARYGASPGTIHRALGLLAERGHVVRIRRRGTLVRRPAGRAPRLVVPRATLRVLSLQGARFTDAVRGLAERYAARHPGWAVTMDSLPPTADERDLAEHLDACDLVLVNEWWLRRFLTDPALAGRFLPLESVPGLAWDPADCLAPAAAWCRTADGATLGLPVGQSPVIACYNRGYLRGARLPEDECTLWEFADRLQTVSVRAESRSYPFLFGLSPNRWPIIVRCFGGELFSADGMRCLLDQPPAVKGIRYLSDLMHVRSLCCLPSAVSAHGPHVAEDLFAQGYFYCAWFSSRALLYRFPFTIGFGPLPHESRRTTHLRLDAVMVPRQAENPERAAGFLNELASPAGQSFLAPRIESLPCRRDTARRYVARQSARHAGAEWFLRALEWAEPVVSAPRMDRVNCVARRLDPVWMGLAAPEAVCRGIVRDLARRGPAGSARTARHQRVV